VRLHERVDVVVESGARGESVGEFVWDVSEWDDPAATWSGLEPTWIAIDGWEVLAVNTQRGRAQANRRHPSGTAAIRLGFRTAAGAWSYRPTSPIQLGQEMRVLVRPRDQAGVAISDLIPIYRGAVRRIADGWTPGRDLFTLDCSLTDRLADLGAVDLPEQATAEGLGDTTDARLTRILGKAGINDYYLRAATGAVEHASSTFARNLLDEAQVSVESETGDMYVDREGFIYFRERLGTGTYPRESSSQLTWANDGDPDAIAPTGFSTGVDLDDVVNQVSMARTGGTAYVAGGPSTESALRYGLRTYQRFDLTCRFDADVEYCADFWLAELQERTQRFDAIAVNVDPNMADDRLLELCDVEIGDMQTVRWTDGDQTMAGTAHVQGVAHQIEGARWTVTVNLWPYVDEGLEPISGAQWDNAQWDVSQWQ